MTNTPAYRHELKYQITPADYFAIRQRLRTVMHIDEHARADGRYTIHSIYFDNVDDKALREKIDGVQYREKFRIRYYNNDLSYLSLEKKVKHNYLCQKTEAQITEAECRQLLDGQTDWMMVHESALIRELYCKMKYQRLQPRILVSYVREPYVFAAGNVRITFDSQIRSSLFHRTFLEEQTPDIFATDHPEDMILEVKYDAFLPEIIACLLQTENLRQQAFSKYGISRRFG